MERRSFIKTVGGIGVATAAGGAALLAASGPAAAATDDYGDVTITSDDGVVKYVSIYGNSTIEWSGFENPAEYVDVTIEAKVDGETNYQELYSTSADLTEDSWGGSGETHSGVGTSGTISSTIGLDEDGNFDDSTDWAVVQASDYEDEYAIPSNPIDAEVLEADSDGSTADFSISIRAIYTWYRDAGETVEYQDNFVSTVDVEVENEERSASASGSGGATGA